MIRRINFTGRKRISRKRISIFLNEEEGSITSFDVELDLEGMELPETAKVIVEAYHKSVVRRYHLGSVENSAVSRGNDLSFFQNPKRLKFRILVVGTSGKILALARRMRPVLEKKSHILPVEVKDLEQRQIWSVDFAGGEPTLLLNEKISGIQDSVPYESKFRCYACPAVLREILTRMIFVETIGSVGWHEEWLRFATQILEEKNPPKIPELDPANPHFNSQRAMSWINRAGKKLSERMKDEWRDVKNEIEVET